MSCPHCDIKLKATMVDIDGTNLVECYVCPECGYGMPALL
jgi:Zn ribbon nucleic-acid-binding protein